MPTISLGEFSQYYETFGQVIPGEAPVVLIHGSTGTGADWGLVAPLLAQSRYVIVPDCRGHGRSTNPHQTYSFSEMAADTAALVRALGFERAHIIGHSNGGNVALLTVMEHPDVVQTAIIQAGNAYVSPDLGEKEPAVFDPERIARQDPVWHTQLKTDHTAVHGPNYWRTLLKLTLDAILGGPNYTPQELAAVERPVLIIQGANDRVNAEGKHAQYMQTNIPFAEIWLPEDTGHNVHEEHQHEWIRRVIDFIERRGDELNEALHRLGQDQYADPRETIYEVRARRLNTPSGGWEVSGKVLYPGQAYAIEKVAHQALPGADLNFAVNVLLHEGAPWAMVNRGVADLRRQPHILAERVSQTLLGEVVRVLETDGDWSLVRLNLDGYMGWTQTRTLHMCSEDVAVCNQQAFNARIKAEFAEVHAAPGVRPGLGVNPLEYRLPGKLVFSTRVGVNAIEGNWACISLPDGLQAWLRREDVLMDADPQPAVLDALQLIRRSQGTPYLWGGRTPFGYDCSGFAQALHAFLGVAIPRDADQQFRAGEPVEGGTPEPGDLIFFGPPEDGSPNKQNRITHVAISLGGWEIIHANGTAWSVSLNSLSADSPRYSQKLAEQMAGVRRFL